MGLVTLPRCGGLFAFMSAIRVGSLDVGFVQSCSPLMRMVYEQCDHGDKQKDFSTFLIPIEPHTHSTDSPPSCWKTVRLHGCEQEACLYTALSLCRVLADILCDCVCFNRAVQEDAGGHGCGVWGCYKGDSGQVQGRIQSPAALAGLLPGCAGQLVISLWKPCQFWYPEHIF